jgi:hypothetical protein
MDKEIECKKVNQPVQYRKGVVKAGDFLLRQLLPNSPQQILHVLCFLIQDIARDVFFALKLQGAGEILHCIIFREIDKRERPVILHQAFDFFISRPEIDRVGSHSAIVG